MALCRLTAVRHSEESLDSAERLYRRALDEPTLPTDVRALAELGMT